MQMHIICFTSTSTKVQILTLQVYIRDGSCQPLSNKFNAYVFAIKVPGNVRMTYWNTIYTLEEIEFHTPSEHSFDGLKSDLEVQFNMAQVLSLLAY